MQTIIKLEKNLQLIKSILERRKNINSLSSAQTSLYLPLANFAPVVEPGNYRFPARS
ncbi:hypothetical protein SERLA73DRAFT_180563 [Serpula lacrymans var. lacrymans S7.3]|uniref:Uncharacterized protein n=2 Tax=Serpula lacrymans var. lacrymans TaxID=341189 RepID=F8PVA9_SERL3|nr:uncharacterized protein SERLADRAFT_466219 [Serpula lacrymans var. lacrymans S7.9]EGO00119.1 hypothetical protein SERLA73DRAFT_180563 [Serpula lacrymans var. lacrymans S7.3]EGO25682.1 hypothetical protein SERLADRAFT_466219 [Serpula lacrymans var. lacrymans S7.9]